MGDNFDQVTLSVSAGNLELPGTGILLPTITLSNVSPQTINTILDGLQFVPDARLPGGW